MEEQIKIKKRKSRKLPKCVRSEEWIKLIQAIPQKDKTTRIGFLVAYASGMRLSEVLRFSPEHFTKNSIFIPESKYGVERYVPIPKGWKEEFVKSIPLKVSGRTLQRKFKMYSKLARLNPKYTFHSLRHGFATRCLESGMPINQLQVLLGHANISTTSIYVKANPLDAIKNYEDYF